MLDRNAGLTAIARRIAMSGCVLPALLLMAAAPRPHGNQGDATVRYHAHDGDTVQSIAQAYLTDAAGGEEIARLNHLSSRAVLGRGTVVTVPTRFLRAEPLNALVTTFRGQVTVNGMPVTKIGALLREGGLIETAANASVSFSLADGSSITLPSRSVVRVQRLRRILLTGQVDRVFLLDLGRSETEVNPRHGPDDRFEIRTPVSVAAVRGTLFRVAANEGGKSATAGVLRGEVRLRPPGAAADGGPSLREGFGAFSDDASAGTAVPLLPAPRFSPVFFRDDGVQVFGLSEIEGAAQYRLQVAADEDFRDILQEQVASRPELQVPGMEEGLYYVRATAIDGKGIEGLPTVHTYRYAKPKA